MQKKPILEDNFNTQSALGTIRSLNFIRVCGSEGERRAMDISFHHGADFVNNAKFAVDVWADLSTTDDCRGKIAVAQHFISGKPFQPGEHRPLQAVGSRFAEPAGSHLRCV